MSLCLRLQQAVETCRQADSDFDRLSREKKVSRREMAAAREARDATRATVDEVIELVKAQQVLTISSVEQVKFFSRLLQRFAERGALRRVVIRGSGDTRLSEATNQKIRKALLAYGFKACDQMFDLPRVA